MSKSFEFKLRADPQVVIAKAKKIAEQNGVVLAGDTKSGWFSGHGVKGEYRVKDRTILITVTKKPLMMPWFAVRSRLRSFFEFEPDHKKQPAEARGARTPPQRVVANLKEKKKNAAINIFELIEKLGNLKEKGVLTEEEFQAQKQKLFERL